MSRPAASWIRLASVLACLLSAHCAQAGEALVYLRVPDSRLDLRQETVTSDPDTPSVSQRLLCSMQVDLRTRQLDRGVELRLAGFRQKIRLDGIEVSSPLGALDRLKLACPDALPHGPSAAPQAANADRFDALAWSGIEQTADAIRGAFLLTFPRLPREPVSAGGGWEVRRRLPLALASLPGFELELVSRMRLDGFADVGGKRCAYLSEKIELHLNEQRSFPARMIQIEGSGEGTASHVVCGGRVESSEARLKLSLELQALYSTEALPFHTRSAIEIRARRVSDGTR
ncbi:MAG: hypothetical protein JXR96_08630 [Deltaproteobacteria bacterium]|nr:hypothetical protein [Deltaproteobacteria bacterium]